MPYGSAKFHRDRYGAPVELLSIDRSLKVSATAASGATAVPIPMLADGLTTPTVIGVKATGSAILMLGTNTVTAADFTGSPAAAPGALIQADDGWLDLPIRPEDGFTHFAVIRATVGGAAADCEVYIEARR